MMLRDALAVVDCALHFLPANMTSTDARAMLLAIALQESRLSHRKQINGPAKSFWQFEVIGVVGVMSHPASKPHFALAMSKLEYGRKSSEYVHDAIEYDQVLACLLARLLLWTHPEPLPGKDHPHTAWDYYLELWRPGKPHPETWPGNFEAAWQLF